MVPSDYIGIELWHRQSGSFQYYIEQLQRAACYDKAPLNAIYCEQRGHAVFARWVTVDDLRPEHPFHAQYAAEIARRVKETRARQGA